MTVAFGIWKYDVKVFTYDYQVSTVYASIDTFFFTLVWLLMIWSHITAVVTKPGYMPKGTKNLDESVFPAKSSFKDIMRLREYIYHEVIVRKKIRQGTIAPFKDT